MNKNITKIRYYPKEIVCLINLINKRAIYIDENQLFSL